MRTLPILCLALGSATLLGAAVQPAPASALPPALQGLLQYVELIEPQDGSAPIIRITGANLQIVNGLGATNGNPGAPYAVDAGSVAANGAGNLILGYSEQPLNGPAERDGSHNLIVGPGHEYRSFGAIVLGYQNRAAAPYANVAGGAHNQATALGAMVAGGSFNLASGPYAVVGGGAFNAASGDSAFVGGGFRSGAAGPFAAVSGGYKSLASGTAASVNGGDRCRATGDRSTVSGGSDQIGRAHV